MVFIYKLSIFLIALQTTFFFTNGYPSNPTSISSYETNVEMPESCKNKNMTYCFDETGYPFDIVDKLLSKNPINLRVISSVRPDSGIGQREGENNFIYTGCPKNSVESPIYYIVDEHNDVRVVIQSEKFYKQIISIEECSRTTPGLNEAFDEDEIKNNNMACENLRFDYNFTVLRKDFTGIELVHNIGGLPGACVTRARR